MAGAGRQLRRRHGVLLDALGNPEGGQWNFDADNRQPWPGNPPEPVDSRPRHDHSALWRQIEAAGVDGSLRPEQLDLAAFVRLADQLAIQPARAAQ